MQQFRKLGPRGLDAWIATYGTQPSPQLDAVCGQKDAHTALLYWHTDLDAAVAEARRTARPILSLRLLGRLERNGRGLLPTLAAELAATSRILE